MFVGKAPLVPQVLTNLCQCHVGWCVQSCVEEFGEVWTSPMIAWVIEEEFGVPYHPGHVRKLLHLLGFSVQRPRRVLSRANASEQDRWHRHTYPNLKKKLGRKTGR